MEGPERLEPGRAAFNRGEYFSAHELWEDVWHGLAGDDRTFVQGLIQIAAGLHHLREHRPGPAASLLRKGLQKLSRGTPDSTVNLRIVPLTGQLTRLLAELAAPGTSVADTTTFEL